MHLEVKEGFGRFMGRWFADLVPTTPMMREFCSRELKRAVLVAPSRMIDAAEDMVLKYFRVEDDKTTPTAPHKLPIVICAFAKDFTPTGRDYTRQLADPVEITFPDDPKERIFKLTSSAQDWRVQVAFFAYDEPTAKSLAAQFVLFTDRTNSRRFDAEYRFAGCKAQFPVQIDDPAPAAINVQTESKNLTILAVDLTLRCTVPLFHAPKVGEPNDGKGQPGTDDPAGYPALIQAHQVGVSDGRASVDKVVTK